ncbi:dihydropteroate synthase [Ferruginivarius sediminum]|uniref:Dihydropteroate synthase n=1 Tax=Ferruginivarius sediminum TaxID=2661937 RepID=A0A369TC35_9PROT|nr:dihydropteroate synthase [Ferruginivarius sediminum]RDD61965.1 dihydropteroate synthase [Ferruginivarius sediminum]
MTQHVYLDPVCITGPQAAAESALPLAGGPLRFNACQVARRDDAAPAEVARQTLTIPDLAQEPTAKDWLPRLSRPRAAIAGLTFEKPRVMGVLNVTPDSFSDGGDRFDGQRAIDDGLAMWEAGADILDIGGESTRPNAEPVPVEEELRRVLPVIEALTKAGCRVSIDTRHARTMREAIAAGARIVNDVTALTWDEDSTRTVAEAGVPVILMHIQGTPRTMQRDPRYDDAALDVYDWLAARVADCEAAGIARENIVVDPGVGFGKTVQHNLELMDRLALFQGLGCPVMLGVSRKSTIGRIGFGAAPKDRLPGSLAAELAGVQRGVQIVRVHDVGETVQALEMWRAIALAETPAHATA